MAEYSTVFIYHNFFIHSSFGGHLGCFHVLAIVNNAAVNMGVHISFRVSVFCFGFGFLDICPGVGLLDRMVVPFLVL